MPMDFGIKKKHTKIWPQTQKLFLKTKVADITFSKHFYGCHYKTSKEINLKKTIVDIFKIYLVRSVEVAIIKNVWKKLRKFS